MTPSTTRGLAVPFRSVDEVLVDPEGNLYFRGALPWSMHPDAAKEAEDDGEGDDEEDENAEQDADVDEDEDEDEDEDQDEDEDAGESYDTRCFGAIWSTDASLALRWFAPVAIRRMGLLTPGHVTALREKQDEPVSFPMADGKMRGAPAPTDALIRHARCARDPDGSWVVVGKRSIGRVVIARSGVESQPLFPPKGLLARWFSDDAIDCSLGGDVAFASDGDLVVHHASLQGSRVTRFDREGRKRASHPFPLGLVPMLTRGADGVVWAFGSRHLFAITPTALVEVPLPEGVRVSEPGLGCTPSGALLFFGSFGHVARATVSGTSFVRWEVLVEG